MKHFNSYKNYKPSGVDWIGDIPEHWDTIRLKFLLVEKMKYGANESAVDEDKSQPRYIRITDISEDGSLYDDTFKSLDFSVAKEYLLEENDLLFARSGATVGKTFLYQKSWGIAAFAGYLIRARFMKNRVNANYIYYCTLSKGYREWIESVTNQATIQNVGADKYVDFIFPISSVKEQKNIADFLDQETSKIDKIIAKQKKLIDKIKEYRSTLISAAVTGKIDIRGEIL